MTLLHAVKPSDHLEYFAADTEKLSSLRNCFLLISENCPFLGSLKGMDKFRTTTFMSISKRVAQTFGDMKGTHKYFCVHQKVPHRRESLCKDY